MQQKQLLIHVIEVLTSLNIEYMITGSYASSFQGQPRLTHDIDLLIISIPEGKIEQLAQLFPFPHYYLDSDSIRDANTFLGHFNLIESSLGDKIDFWILQDEPFDHSRFSRKKQIQFEDKTIWVSAPEDTILAKLKWAKLSNGSEKQMIDVLNVYELQYDSLDLTYLEEWVHELGLKIYWQEIISRANPL